MTAQRTRVPDLAASTLPVHNESRSFDRAVQAWLWKHAMFGSLRGLTALFALPGPCACKAGVRRVGAGCACRCTV